MTSSATKAKSTDESGIQSIQDKKMEARILPYYCCWYRSIFPRSGIGAESDSEERCEGRANAL
jgi:hypothetical protein